MKKFILTIILLFTAIQSFAIEINEEFLNQFEGMAIKTIRKSETAFSNSNKTKNEFNGIKDFQEILGKERKSFATQIIYINDTNEYQDNIKTTWYSNVRNNYFLYHQTSPITNKYMKEGDLMLLGKVDDKNLIILIVQKSSKRIQKLLNLFNLNIAQNEDQEIKIEKNIDIETEQSKISNKEELESPYSNTSNLKEHEDLKIYKNLNTNKIVIVGKATKIKDGDTIVLSDLFNVRLFGIDTPEKKQICLDKNGKEYNCGIKAREYLEKIMGKGNITCVNNGTEKYGRFLFVCKNNRYNMNQEMVKSGWAVSYYNNIYKEDEKYAEEHKLGIWQGKFTRPDLWRKEQKTKKSK